MKRLLAVLVAALLLASLASPALAGSNDKPQVGPPVDVMTQNLYVGADLFRLVSPPSPECAPFAGTALLIPCQAAETLAVVDRTNFPERAAAIADEVKKEKPDLIGLQEVSLIRTQSPSDFLTNPLPNATTVRYDYLEILLDALATEGLHYYVAAEIQEADVELPALAGFAGNVPQLFDVRLTDRDVILARRGVETANATVANYAPGNQLTLNIGGLPVEFTRGWTAVDATVKDKTYRFVNTHLEVGGDAAPIRNLQAIELATVLSTETLPVILVGDFNVSPHEGDSPPGLPSAYATLTGAGYVDAWTVRNGPAGPGYTCCQSETLDNKKSNLDERIDLIFVRNADGLGPTKVEVIGDERRDKTRSGLWPSDHAGVVAKLHIRTPKTK